MVNIAVVYTEKLPTYEEHLSYMESACIANDKTDCYLVLGQDYNEDILGFQLKSRYRNNFIKIIPFNELPEYKQTHNDTDERNAYMSRFYNHVSADLICQHKISYDIVIHTHTNVFKIPIINWDFLHREIMKTDCLYANPEKSFVCGSMQTMTSYLYNTLDVNVTTRIIDIKTETRISEIEKYNVLFGFRGFEETCDSERYTNRLSHETKNYSFEKMKDYDTVYFSNLTLKKTYKQVMNLIKKPFILVSGEGDCECPNQLFDTIEDFNEFVNWDKLKHWFCQNCLITHPKITLIPLGLDYHTMMYYSHIRGDRGPKMLPIEQEKNIMDLRKFMKPFWERIPVCYGNFQFLTITKYSSDRHDAIDKIPSNAIYYDCKHLRKQTFHNQISFAFVASPFGQDYECIRTWEALCLGCIAILKSSPLDSLYADLPVVIINDWSDVTPEFLQKTLIEYKEKHFRNEFKYEKLHKHYWVRLLQNKKDELMRDVGML